jgi:hypothetical protein
MSVSRPVASEIVLRDRLRAAAVDLKGVSERFLLSEWTNVVDAWGLTTLDGYSTVQRMGRKSRLGPNQRATLARIRRRPHGAGGRALYDLG